MELHGIGVGRGIAAGPVLRMPEPFAEPADIPNPDSLEDSQSASIQALATVAQWLRDRGGKLEGAAKDVLEAQAMMAADPTLAADITGRIANGKTAERAVFEAFASFQATLQSLGGYLAERAADLADVGQRVIAELKGVPAPGVPDSDVPFILVAHDLAPADTAMLDFSIVQALVTRDGGPTSHTAILARSKSIPAIVGVTGAENLRDGQIIVVDAANSTIIVDASANQVADAQDKRQKWINRATAPLTNGATKDGHLIPLLANIGSVTDAKIAIESGAEGVGLFRTEFLYLDAQTAPSVEQQFDKYVPILEPFAGKKVVARTLDAGADKPLAFLNLGEEENPALGVRGLRTAKIHEQLLRDQLSALVRAGKETGVDLWVMAPMVADVAETQYFVSLAREAGVTTAGVMAEIPSLALMAEEVLNIADFVSIGTNDLTQYTLAADRMLGSVAHYQTPWHPAVLRLIKKLGDASLATGKPVGVCGEAAADPDLAVVMAGMGIATLSMTSAALSEVRASLLEITFEEAQAKAMRVLQATTAEAAHAAATA